MAFSNPSSDLYSQHEARLTLSDVAVSRQGSLVVEGLTATAYRGQCLCFTGASGCGKTTLLQAIAQLIELERGEIQHNYRRLAYLFQQPTLLPWRTARENVALVPHSDMRLASALFEAFDMTPADQHKYPAELSGGMQQRVALVRALAISPDLLLMDEPFSALDHRLRTRLQNHIIAQMTQGLSVILVSHDREEVLRLAHQIVHLSKPTPYDAAHMRHTLQLDLPPSQRNVEQLGQYFHHPALQGSD